MKSLPSFPRVPFPSLPPLVLQVLATMLQCRRFDDTLRPFPTFSGWSPAAIATMLSFILRLFLPSPRSISCQVSTLCHLSLSGDPSSPSPLYRCFAASLTLAFSLYHSHSHLSHTAHVGALVRDAVIAMPPHFRKAERRTLLLAAQLAGISVLALINEHAGAVLI